MTTTQLDANYPLPTERFASRPTVEAQAEEVTGVWLSEAYANRRDDLIQLLDDLADDPTEMYFEHMAIAESLGADPDDLELGSELQEAISEAANETLHQIGRLLIGVMVDELGERIYDLALPETIRDAIYGVARGTDIRDAGTERLLLATLVEMSDRYLNSTV